MRETSAKINALYNFQCEQALEDYWQASDGLASFLELIEDDSELYAYFIEAYGDYGKED